MDWSKKPFGLFTTELQGSAGESVRMLHALHVAMGGLNQGTGV